MGQGFSGLGSQVSGCGNWSLPNILDWRIIKGDWIAGASTNYWGAFYFASGGLRDDLVEWLIYLNAGTYTLKYLYVKGVNQGIHTWIVDGTHLGTTVDAYAAATSYNNLASITGISITETGKHILGVTSITANGASGGYTVGFSGLALWRTA